MPPALPQVRSTTRTTPDGARFMWMIYGLQKIGKSLTVADFAYDALVFAPDTSVWDGPRDWYGVGPRYRGEGAPTYNVRKVWTFPDIYELFMQMTAAGYAPPLLVIEDFNVIYKNSEDAAARTGLSGWDLVSAVRQQALIVLGFCRNLLPCSTILLAHEGKEEHSVRGRAVRGGPLVPGQLVEDMGLLLDGVVRMVLDPTTGRKPVSSMFRTLPDANWIQGFRGGIPDKAPANLRECLRAAGYATPYPKGLEWQDGVSDEVAARALAGINRKLSLRDSVKIAMAETLTGDMGKRYFNPDPDTGAFRHFRAALQNGADRATLNLLRRRSLYVDLGLDIPPELTAGMSVGFAAPVAAPAPATAATPPASALPGQAVITASAPNPFGAVAPAPVPVEPSEPAKA